MLRPTPWTPLSEQEPKQKKPCLLLGRPIGERARRWQQMMDDGLYPNMSALARGEGVTPAAVSRALIKLRRMDTSLGGNDASGPAG